MTKFQRILTILLAAQALLAAFALWPRQAPVAAGQPLLGEFDPAQVTSLLITDNAGKQLILQRSGESWSLASAGGFPVEPAKVTPVLEKLAQIQTSRLVTRTAASHKRLQVAAEDYQRRLVLTLASGAQKVLLVGSAGGAQTVHVRLEGQDEVYLTSALTATDLGSGAANWIDTAFMALAANDVSALRLVNASGELSFSKDETGAWVQADLPAGRQSDSSRINTLVSRLATLRMVEPLGKEALPEHGFDQPTLLAELVVPSADGTSTQIVTLELGAFDEPANQYIARSSTSEYIVRVAGFNLSEAVAANAETYLAPLPTPAP